MLALIVLWVFSLVFFVPSLLVIDAIEEHYYNSWINSYEDAIKFRRFNFWKKLKAVYIITFAISCFLSVPVVLITGLWTLIKLMRTQIDILRN
jgi:hypothetical protein